VDGCNAVLQLRPNETKALYRSGQAYRKLGRCHEAAAALKEVKKKAFFFFSLFKGVCVADVHK
jgi:hypothetical protein